LSNVELRDRPEANLFQRKVCNTEDRHWQKRDSPVIAVVYIVDSELELMRSLKTMPFTLIDLFPFRVSALPGLPVEKAAGCSLNQQFRGSRAVRREIDIEALVAGLREEQRIRIDREAMLQGNHVSALV
jgi:hypothetical protein